MIVAMAYELAPAYASAAEGSRSMLGALGDMLGMIGYVIGDLVGGILVAVGALLFSAALLQSKKAVRWVVWLGFAAAATGCVGPFGRFVSALVSVNFVSLLCFVVWMVAMGVIVWRMPASLAVPTTENR